MPFRPSAFRLSHKNPPSSQRWLARHFKDPVVKQRLSHPDNYRSRSAFKLLELEDAYKFLRHADVHTIVDLGAAPGGWSQVAAAKMGWKVEDAGLQRAEAVADGERALKTAEGKREKLRQDEALTMNKRFGLKDSAKRARAAAGWSTTPDPDSDPLDELGLDFDESPKTPPGTVTKGRGTVIGVDLLPIYPIPGVKTLKMDFLASETADYIEALLPPESEGKVDVILSDMAANFSGNRIHDVQSSLDICHAVFEFTHKHLRTAESIGRTRGGVLV
ncbi:hypothetical protein EUX98_g2493 [Antrodiella citrinella]|uniref:rRNA methyltransferase 2, mitochondrial n=1 Tax=Antrodiella citrinella TaxID=2447956 RepID=A0A4S4N1S3_9APHY|nr:hypothetical protein EUX98_g2493 [Antrodiella citrinella]